MDGRYNLYMSLIEYQPLIISLLKKKTKKHRYFYKILEKYSTLQKTFQVWLFIKNILGSVALNYFETEFVV